jgi:hypothetical protein
MHEVFASLFSLSAVVCPGSCGILASFGPPEPMESSQPPGATAPTKAARLWVSLVAGSSRLESP